MLSGSFKTSYASLVTEELYELSWLLYHLPCDDRGGSIQNPKYSWSA